MANLLVKKKHYRKDLIKNKNILIQFKNLLEDGCDIRVLKYSTIFQMNLLLKLKELQTKNKKLKDNTKIKYNFNKFEENLKSKKCKNKNRFNTIVRYEIKHALDNIEEIMKKSDKSCNDLSELKKLENKKNAKCKEILKAEKLFFKLIWNRTHFVVLLKLFVKVRKLRDFMSKNKINKKNGKKLKKMINKKLPFLKPKKNKKVKNPFTIGVNKFIRKNHLNKNCFNKKGNFDNHNSEHKSNCEKLKNFVTNILKENGLKFDTKKSGEENLEISYKILLKCNKSPKDKNCEKLKKILKEFKLKPKKVTKNKKVGYSFTKGVDKFVRNNHLDKHCFNKKGNFEYKLTNKSNCEKLKNIVIQILAHNGLKFNSKKSGEENLEISYKILLKCNKSPQEKNCSKLKKVLKELKPKNKKAVKNKKASKKKSDLIKKAINGPTHKNEDTFINESLKLQKLQKNKKESVKETCQDKLIKIKTKKPKVEDKTKTIKNEKKGELMFSKVSGPGPMDTDIIITKKLKKSIKKKSCSKKEKILKNSSKSGKNKSNNKNNPFVNGPEESSKDTIIGKESDKLSLIDKLKNKKKCKKPSSIIEKEIEKKIKKRAISENCKDNVIEKKKKHKKKRDPLINLSLIKAEKKKEKSKRPRNRFTIELNELERLRKECKSLERKVKKNKLTNNSFNFAASIQKDKVTIELLKKCKFNKFLSRSFVKKLLKSRNK